MSDPTDQYHQECAALSEKYDTRMVILLVVEKSGRLIFNCVTAEKDLSERVPIILMNCAQQLVNAPIEPPA